MPAKKTAKKAAKKAAKKKPKQPLTIDIAPAGELALNVEQELTKLPTEATHNHFHRIADEADNAREKMRSISLVSLVLCGLELEHLKGDTHRQSVSPWKKWVGENCEFSYKTATRYIKIAKCAKEGLIDGLDPDLVPETAPSLMSKTELQDVCKSLADALQGFGSRRQLYLDLEVIKTPQRCTIDDNRNTKGAPKKKTASNSEESLKQKREDATVAYRTALKKLDDAERIKQHRHLHRDTVEELIAALSDHIETLKEAL